MKKIIFLFILISTFGFSQKKKNKQVFPPKVICTMGSAKLWDDEVKDFQKKLNEEYKNPEESPLRGENFNKFKAHPFFPINHKYVVVAQLKRTENATPFEIPTTSGKTKKHKEYGKVYFKIDGVEHVLTVYQNLGLLENPEYKDYLFLSFRDLTNGNETYGGGKYLDLRIPKNDKIYIDFNQSYHPYCAYNATDYNCPIVLKENWLNIRIEAGVKYEDIWFEH